MQTKIMIPFSGNKYVYSSYLKIVLKIIKWNIIISKDMFKLFVLFFAITFLSSTAIPVASLIT